MPIERGYLPSFSLTAPMKVLISAFATKNDFFKVLCNYMYGNFFLVGYSH